MTRFLLAPLAICFMLFITACPVSTSHPLSKDGDKIDKRLLGTWINDSANVEAGRVTLTRRTDFMYDINVEEKGTIFMADTTTFVGWLTTIRDQRFLVLQTVKQGERQPVFYVYQIEIGEKGVMTHDITLKVGGTDAITSIESYRQEVEASMGKEGFLAGEIAWRKK